MVTPMNTSSTRQALGLAKSGRSSRCAITEREEEEKGAGSGAGAKCDPLTGIAGGDRTQQHHRIQIDMRVEPGESEAGEDGDAKTFGFIGSGIERAAVAPGGPQAAQAVSRKKQSSAITHRRRQPGQGRHQRTKTGDAGGDQYRVRHGANRADGEDMLAAQSLAQDKSVLRPDGDDQAEPQQKAGNISDHTRP